MRVFLFGDPGTDKEATVTLQAVVNEAAKKSHDMAIHLGNISYANGKYQFLWDV